MILMATLGPRASAAVKAGRGALRGTDADLERIEAALRARLGADVLPPDDAPSPTPARASAWRFVSPAIGVCVIGGALFFALRPASPPSAQPNAVNVQLLKPAAPSATIAGPPNVAGSATPAPPTVASAEPASSARSTASSASAAPRLERDPLAQEVALLSRATSALNRGRISEALNVLNEHQRLFPNGVLSEERRAAKAQALCSSGAVAEGRAQLARISANSPAGKRAKQICDSASTPGAGVKGH